MYEQLTKQMRSVYQEVDCPDCPLAKDCMTLQSVCAFTRAANVIEEQSGLIDRYGGETGIKNLQEYANKYWELLKNAPRWIPVKERFPKKENRTYWICTDAGYQCECRWTNNRFGIGESDEWDWSIMDVPQYHKVVAWMFLPEPYEMSKEECV